MFISVFGECHITNSSNLNHVTYDFPSVYTWLVFHCTHHIVFMNLSLDGYLEEFDTLGSMNEDVLGMVV